MQAQLDIPIVLRRVGIHGPSGVREIDVILDTGAVYTVIAWDVAKDIGYDPPSPSVGRLLSLPTGSSKRH